MKNKLARNKDAYLRNHSELPHTKAFTLIELLVVIAPPQAGAWFNADYGNNHNEANLPGASQQAWYAANPDFGFNETVAAASLKRPADFILLGDAGRSDGTAS